MNIQTLERIDFYPQAAAISLFREEVHVLPKLIRVAEPSVRYSISQGVVLNSWQAMTDELLKAGYTITKIAHLTGIPRRTVQRWFNREEITQHSKLFSQVLSLYCHYKYFGEPHE